MNVSSVCAFTAQNRGNKTRKTHRRYNRVVYVIYERRRGGFRLFSLGENKLFGRRGPRGRGAVVAVACSHHGFRTPTEEADRPL